MRSRSWLALMSMLTAASFLDAAGFSSLHAENAGQNFVAQTFNEIETKYIFGFTEGSGIGLQGEKEFSTETVGRFGKRDGRYAATETKLEYEFTPSQFFQIEFGGLVASHNINNVTGLENRNAFEFSGLFAEVRYLFLERGPNSPISGTLSFEPNWRRIDETDGSQVTNYEFETKLALDAELVENRVYLGFNAIYEPEVTHTPNAPMTRESTLGLSSALSVRPIAPLTLGVEVGYFRHYDGNAFNQFTGDALFVGPTLFWQLSPKSFMTAAWAVQVRGHTVGEPSNLELEEFSRQKGKLKFAYEF
ncbi:MAG TPA: hypothetical protein VKT73_08910 [Xanthobacteraceae bacterium]|nr:hypothetical protein [Xanthobacteraceae bacterium]